MKIICDIYKIDKEKRGDLIYEDRIIVYDSRTKKLLNFALVPEKINKYKIGQIIED